MKRFRQSDHISAHMPSRLSDVDAYARSLQMHSQIEEYLKRGPSWMQIGSTETGTDWAPWVHWQRTVFQVSDAEYCVEYSIWVPADEQISAAHKVKSSFG